MPLPLVAMAAKAAVPMLKKAAVKKLKQVAVKKAGQAISGATKGLVPSGVGEAVAGAAAKKALPNVFENGGKMKPKKRKKKVVAKGADRADKRGDRRARRAQNRYNRKTGNPRRYNKGGIAPSGGSGMGAVFAEDEMFKGLQPPPKKKNNAEILEEKSEEAGKKRPTKEERKANRQEKAGARKEKVEGARAKAKGMRDRYEARAEKNKHHSAAMTAMSSYMKGGKMNYKAGGKNPTDPKKKIKSMLEGGASDKEINAYLKKSGIDKTHDVSWDNVEMKVTMKPKKGDFGEPDKPGQRSDNFKHGGKMKMAMKAARKARLVKKGKDLIRNKAGEAAAKGKYKKADRLVERGAKKLEKVNKITKHPGGGKMNYKYGGKSKLARAPKGKR